MGMTQMKTNPLYTNPCNHWHRNNFYPAYHTLKNIPFHCQSPCGNNPHRETIPTCSDWQSCAILCWITMGSAVPSRSHQKLKRKVVISGISALSLSWDRARNYFPIVFLQASSSKRPLQRSTLNLHSAVSSPQLPTRIKGEAEAAVLHQWYRNAESDNSS